MQPQTLEEPARPGWTIPPQSLLLFPKPTGASCSLARPPPALSQMAIRFLKGALVRFSAMTSPSLLHGYLAHVSTVFSSPALRLASHLGVENVWFSLVREEQKTRIWAPSREMASCFFSPSEKHEPTRDDWAEYST